jgi:hypothetical protein
LCETKTSAWRRRRFCGDWQTKVSTGRSGLEAVARAPGREQQIGQMRDQESSPGKKEAKTEKSNQA